MSVYVDDMKAEFSPRPGRRYIMCHMWADTLPELLAMAVTIDLNAHWLQTPPKARWVHFDCTQSKKAQALGAGAVQKEWREIVAAAEAQRSEPTFAQYYRKATFYFPSPTSKGLGLDG